MIVNSRNLSYKNCRKNPCSTAILVFIITLMSFTLLVGILISDGLKNNFTRMQARMGAEIMAVPYEATTKQEFDKLILHGQPGNYYMPLQLSDKISKREGIEDFTTQLYFTSFRLDIFDFQVEFIGLDKKTDFVIEPWLTNKKMSDLEVQEVVVGYELRTLVGKKIKLFGTEVTIIDSLEQTEGYMDKSIYTDFSTIQYILSNMSPKDLELFGGLDPQKVTSSAFINVEESYLVEQVLDDINIKVRGVEATRKNDMITDTSYKLHQISSILNFMIGVIIVLILIILYMAFKIRFSERNREYAILRIIGATQKKLGEILIFEAIYITLVGTVIGLIAAYIFVCAMKKPIESYLNLTMFTSSVGTIIAIMLIVLLSMVSASGITALVIRSNLCKKEIANAIRSDK